MNNPFGRYPKLADGASSPVSPLQDFDVNLQTLNKLHGYNASRVRAACTSKLEVLVDVLETLWKARLAPIDFLIHLLDASSSFIPYQTSFYNSTKLPNLV